MSTIDPVGPWAKDKLFKKGQLVSYANQLTGLWEMFVCLRDMVQMDLYSTAASSYGPSVTPTLWMYISGEGKSGLTGSCGSKEEQCAYKRYKIGGNKGQLFYAGTANPTTIATEGDIFLNSSNGSLWIFKNYSWQSATTTLLKPNGILTGQGAPNTSTSTNSSSTNTIENDLYLDTLTSNLYSYNNNKWSTMPVGSLLGNRGNKGEEGQQGAQGLKGETGGPGGMGLVGPVGDTGAQGGTGAQGDRGETGKQGEVGFTGAKGATGQPGKYIAAAPASNNASTISKAVNLVCTSKTINNIDEGVSQVYYPYKQMLQLLTQMYKYQIWDNTVSFIGNSSEGTTTIVNPWTQDPYIQGIGEYDGFIVLSSGKYQISYSFIASWTKDVKIACALFDMNKHPPTERELNSYYYDVRGINENSMVDSSKSVVKKGISTNVSLVATFASAAKLVIGFAASDMEVDISLYKEVGGVYIYPTVSFVRLGDA